MHSIYFKNYLYIYLEWRKLRDMRLRPVSNTAQQLDRELHPATTRTFMASFVKEWSAAKPVRSPLSPREGLKLRDVDIVLIEDRCKGCSYCIEFCPRKVFEQGKRLNKIGVHPPRIKDRSLCVGCGVCEEICPDFAIFLVDKGEPSPRKEVLFVGGENE